MTSIIGNKLKVSIFGESHGEAIGVTIDGLPAGVELDLDFISAEMKRRAPGRDPFSTPRKEKDEPRILSGIFNGKTTGAPLAAIIENSNTKSGDYSILATHLRPSHSDYPAMVRYNGFNDYRGGGHFSGRLTALIVFAGAICKQILAKKGIIIGSHIKSIKDVNDQPFDRVNLKEETLITLKNMDFPVLDKEVAQKMQKEILNAKEEQDSVGGIIEAAILNLPVGIGNPMFGSVESELSRMMFSIPAVKGLEFGEGFGITKLRGSQANDNYCIKEKEQKNAQNFSTTVEDTSLKTQIATTSNNNGGILGGITNGMPVVFSVAIKPTASIASQQNTVNIENMENTKVSIEGRHDPCIVKRAVPVIESAAAITILDLMIDKF